jgi:DMSO/TMAO reductase YedYZ heme-binding membrane subunit
MAPAITTLPGMAKALGGWCWKRSQRAGYIALVLVVGHLVTLGLKGWLTPEKWPAGLVPISLIALVVALVPLAVRYRLLAQRRE